MSEASAGWKHDKERGSVFLILLIRWIAEHLGRGIARTILIPIVIYFLLVLPRQRKASLEYLDNVLGHKARWMDVAKHIHHFAATILDRVYFLAGQFQRFDIKLHNHELVLDYFKKGEGCILLGSHLGSFEVMRSLGIKDKKLPIKIIMDRQHNTKITKIFEQLDSEMTASILELDGPMSMLQLQETLSKGGFIGLLGDRITADRTTAQCQFMGKTAEFPTNPYLLAHILAVPVIVFYGLYQGGNRYDIQSLVDV